MSGQLRWATKLLAVFQIQLLMNRQQTKPMLMAFLTVQRHLLGSSEATF